MLRKFKSIADNQFGYAYDSQAWESKSPINSHFRMFYTYNDGLCQHSGDWGIQIEHMADYLASLAEAMLADDELTQELYFDMHRQPSVEQIEFAASVLYKKVPDDKWQKPRYFSLEEMKISSSDSKRHDKRYEEIRDIHDGTPNSIYRILIPEYANGLQRYATAEAIRTWALKVEGMYMDLAAEFLEWFKDDRACGREKARELRDAFEACQNVTEGYRLRESAKHGVENYRRSAERAAAKRAEEATAKIEAAAKQEVSNG